MKRIYTIYGLTDEHGQIRYVGQTVQARFRFKAHLRSAPFKVVGFAPLETVTSQADANLAESRWITFFGTDNLMNKVNGGQCGPRGGEMSGTDLRALRLARHLSQNKLAALLKVTGTTVYRWECGDHPVPYSVQLFFQITKGGE